MTTATRILDTRALGKVQVDPAQVLQFPEGLYGFRESGEFALIEENPENPFKWLQSTTETDLAFIVIQPELVFADYKPEVAREDLESIGLASSADAIVFLIVTIPEEHPERMTANLQGPILINKENRKGRQAISMNENHLVRIPILAQENS